jgi:hypothetical protein
MIRFNRYFLLGMIMAGIGLCPIASASAAEKGDACAMLHKEDVEAAFAPRKFDSGKPGFAVKSSPTRAAVTSCTYTSQGGTTKETVTITLGVRRAPSDATGTTPEAAKAGAIQLKATPIKLDGLGKGAYMMKLGNSIQLNVFRGKREWLIFGGNARALDNEAVLAGLMKIAQATLAR